MEPGNVMPEELAIALLSEFDGLIQAEIMQVAPEDIVEYTDSEQELTLRKPHDGLYVDFLVAMIRRMQQEYEGYENAQAIVNEKLSTFHEWYSHHYQRGSGNGAAYGFAYLSAYGTAVKLGFVGTEEEWLESLKGRDGRPAVMRYDAEARMLQWSNDGTTWTDLMSLAELTDPVVAALLEEAQTAAQEAKDAAQEAKDAAQEAKDAAQEAKESGGGTGDAAGGVTSVNGKTGVVELTAEDVEADPAGTGSTLLLKHDNSTTSHSDLRRMVQQISADLANYYTKSATYSREEVDNLVSLIPKFAIKPVAALPAEEISGTTVYLVPSGNTEDLYLEYIYVDGAWELLGSQRVDLTGYAKEAWVEANFQPIGAYLTADDVPGWAMQDQKPEYTAEEVGARPADWMPTAEEVGARPATWTPTAEEVGADTKGTAAEKVSEHDTNTAAHQHILLMIQEIKAQLAAFFDADEETLNEMSELIAAIVANRGTIAELTTNKVSVSDIVDNLVTNVTNKPLSAAQGVALKKLVDDLSASLADYQPKGNYLTEHQSLAHLLPRTELETAINTALAQAKESGEFDGKNGTDGTSVEVTGVSESDEDGGSNVVTFTGGKTLTVKNGKTGAAATLEIVDVVELAYGEAPKVTEAEGSTPQNRKIILHIPAGKPYELTEDDRDDIATRMVEKMGGVVSYVDPATMRVILSNVPEGDYTLYVKLADGTLVEYGPMEEDSDTYYSVTNNLTNCMSDNAATQAVGGGSYTAELTASDGYTLEGATVAVTMGGENITDTAYADGVITIAEVTGDIIITATAVEAANEPEYPNLADPTSADWLEGYRLSLSSGNPAALAGHLATNYIPCKSGDTLEVEGMVLTGYINGTTDTADTAKIIGYSDTAKVCGLYGLTRSGNAEDYGLQLVSDGNIKRYVIMYNNTGEQKAPSTLTRIRIDGALEDGYTAENVVIRIIPAA